MQGIDDKRRLIAGGDAMDARRWRRRATTLTVMIGAILVGAAGAWGELTIKGDTAAWEELNAAFTKLNALSGYRMKTTVKISTGIAAGTTTTVTEVAPPHAFHSLTQANWGTSEMVSVDGQPVRSRSSYSGNEWKCYTFRQPSREAIDAVQGTIDVSREPDTTIAGTPVRGYTWIMTISATGPNDSANTRASKKTSYVGTETGLPRRTVQVGPTDEVITDYYDYAATIEITLPPCKVIIDSPAR